MMLKNECLSNSNGHTSGFKVYSRDLESYTEINKSLTWICSRSEGGSSHHVYVFDFVSTWEHTLS